MRRLIPFALLIALAGPARADAEWETKGDGIAVEAHADGQGRGMVRAQVRRSIYLESVLISIFGAVLGVLLGTVIGVALVRTLAEWGLGAPVIPWSLIVITLVASAIVGVLAALWPAVRAARTGPLEAIADI